MSEQSPQSQQKKKNLTTATFALGLAGLGVVGLFFLSQGPKFQDLPPAEKGAALLQNYDCRSCHQVGVSFRAPALERLYGATVDLADGRKVLADADYIRRSLNQPKADITAGYQPVMPSYKGKIPDQHFEWIMDYMRAHPANKQP